MKKTLCAAALLLAVLFCGCGGAKQDETAAAASAVAAAATAASAAAETSLDCSNRGLVDADLAAYAAQTQLLSLDLTGNALSPAAVQTLLDALPGCEIRWSVPLGSERFDSDMSSLVLPADTAAADVDNLAYFPALSSVDGTATACYQELFAASESMPNVAFSYRADVCGVSVSNTDETADLTGASAVDADALLSAIRCLPKLMTVDLTGQTLSVADMAKLASGAPEVAFLWNVDLCGVTVPGDATEADISGRPVTDIAALSEALACLPKLAKLDMCGCGLSDTEMEGLAAAFPATKFVWEIQVGGWVLRTDVKAFSKGNRESFDGGSFVGGRTDLTNEDIAPLRYCTELVALDLGHARKITDISVIKNMPKLRFLIVAMEGITDISAVSACPELEYLETFQNYIDDMTPLLSLKKLTHLNCSTNMPKDKNLREESRTAFYETLLKMPQLERLWCIRDGFSAEQLDALRAALPNCVINTSGTHSTSNGWRNNDHYREMQKLFNLPTLE